MPDPLQIHQMDFDRFWTWFRFELGLMTQSLSGVNKSEKNVTPQLPKLTPDTMFAALAGIRADAD